MLPGTTEPLSAGFPAFGGKVLLDGAPLDFFDIPAEPAGLPVAVCLTLKGGSPGFFLFPPALGLFFSPFLGLAPVFLLFPTPAFFLLEGNELLDLLQEGFDLFDSGFSCRIDHFFWP